MKKQFLINLILIVCIATASFSLSSCSSNDSSNNAASPSSSSATTPAEETASYPLKMEKMVLKNPDQNNEATYDNFDLLDNKAYLADMSLSNGTTIKELKLQIANVKYTAEKKGDINLVLSLTNGTSSINTGTYNLKLCDCLMCPELTDASNHFTALINYSSEEFGTEYVAPISVCNDDPNNKVELTKLTDKEIAGSYDITDKKTGSSFKGTFTLPLMSM